VADDLIAEADETLAIFHDPKRGPSRVEALIRSLRDALEDARAEIARHHADFARWEEMAARGAGLVEENARLRELLAAGVGLGRLQPKGGDWVVWRSRAIAAIAAAEPKP
jgi:hypothetical protein